MFSKTKTLLLVLFAAMGLLSCSSSMPKDEPDLGIDMDMSQLNTTIKVTTPKKLNSYKIGKQLELEIVNLSDQTLKFNPDEIQIFQVEDDKWKKVSNNMKTILVDDFVVEPNEVSSTKYLKLKPKGSFPDDKMPITILPDVKSNKPIFLRIFVLAHGQVSENSPSNIVGSFVDITLIP